MSDQPTTSEVLREHRYEIDTLKEQTAETNQNINKLIDSMNNLSQNFAVYAEKHDRTREDVIRLSDELRNATKTIRVDLNATKEMVQSHEVVIAGHTPVIDSLRKLNNRLILAAILFVASSSTLGYLVIQGAPK